MVFQFSYDIINSVSVDILTKIRISVCFNNITKVGCIGFNKTAILGSVIPLVIYCSVFSNLSSLLSKTASVLGSFIIVGPSVTFFLFSVCATVTGSLVCLNLESVLSSFDLNLTLRLYTYKNSGPELLQ